MKTCYYIQNTETGWTFDTSEMKFYNPKWSPTFESDKNYLETLIASEPEKFKNCEVVTIPAEKEKSIEWEGVSEPAYLYEEGLYISYWDNFPTLLIEDNGEIKRISRETAVSLGYIK